MTLLWRIDGVREARGFLGGMVRRMKDPRPALRFVGEEMLARTQQRMRAGLDVDGRPFKPSRRVAESGGQTLFDRGALAASVAYSVGPGSLDLHSSDVRARVHYLGGTITPKRASFLTIPLRARGGIFGAGGVTASANRRGDRARQYANTFFRWRHGKLFLLQKLDGGKIRALFLLVRSVRLPARRWLGFGARDVAMAAERLGANVMGGGGK